MGERASEWTGKQMSAHMAHLPLLDGHFSPNLPSPPPPPPPPQLRCDFEWRISASLIEIRATALLRPTEEQWKRRGTEVAERGTYSVEH